MRDDLPGVVAEVCRKVGYDKSRLMDVAIELQRRFRSIPAEAVTLLSRELGVPRVDIESLVSFYAFLSSEPQGKVTIRLCNDVVDRMQGADRVAGAFEEELGIRFGETTPDGSITLAWTACIGMSDQAPAALVNDVVVTHLSSDLARGIVAELRKNLDPTRLIHKFGDGNNGNELVSAMVENNIRQPGPVVLSPLEPGAALAKAAAMSPAEVIRHVKTARLRGRGGAGFPTGLKWEFTRAAPGSKKFVLCNADEGEPGTFKDRVILTEYPDNVFEGMTIAGYAIGAQEGIVYLRAEYAYLLRFLEEVLEQRRRRGLLGQGIAGFHGFDFDIRIQLGAGAYICGEETALISSCEGTRGDPKNRPPFPAQKGYMGCPSIVNNVETLSCVARIMQHGPGWFSSHGSERSAGTKLLSISGDCRRPGVYEVPMGISLGEVMRLAGAENVRAVQVGGASGQLVGPADFERQICYDDLATGGSIMVFGPDRSIPEIVQEFLNFFVEESCGYCTPCRAGNVLLRNGLRDLLQGKADAGDLESLLQLAATIKKASRCGLGQTAPSAFLSSMERFRFAYEALLVPSGTSRDFDLFEATREASRITGRATGAL